MLTTKQKAFSLIELSIVILIVGILVAGVTQGSRLVNLSKLNSAKTLTKSSVVSGITGLELWLETTSDDSFLSAETDNNSNLSTWRDINPQTTNPKILSKTANAFATYKTYGINNLPSVYFNGTSSAARFTGPWIPTQTSKYTLFAVYTSDDNTSSIWRALISNGDSSNSGWRFQKSGTTNRRCATLGSVVDNCGRSVISLSTPEIASVTYDGSSHLMYINGTLHALNGPGGSIANPTGTSTLTVGGNQTSSTGGWQTSSTGWLGMAGEIIVYDKLLNNSDRREIEKYLSKKWGIAVN